MKWYNMRFNAIRALVMIALIIDLALHPAYYMEMALGIIGITLVVVLIIDLVKIVKIMLKKDLTF